MTADDYRLSLDLLEKAFAMFPGLDYCALTLPHAYPTFTLLDHFVVKAEGPPDLAQQQLK